MAHEPRRRWLTKRVLPGPTNIRSLSSANRPSAQRVCGSGWWLATRGKLTGASSRTFVYGCLVRVNESARKHGLADADMLAAVSDVRLAIALDDDSPQRQLVLGFDTSTRLLEVVVLVFEDGREPLIIHAMPARRQYRDLLGERS